MKYEVEKVSSVERKVHVEVPWETVKEELDLAYRGLAKRARVKGFRAGHVPRKVLEQYYKQTVEGEVVNRLVDETFKKAVAEHALVPINNPRVKTWPQLVDDAPLVFDATVEVKPEVEAKDYRGLEVEKKIREVAESEVEKELKGLREKAVVVEQVTDRKDVQKGDMVVIDFFGYVNGETFKGGKGINYTVEVGAGQMIPGFEDALVGGTIGEQKVFDLEFPAGDGPEEVRGKKVEWKVDIKELKKKVYPEIDDEFAKDLGEFDTLEELKTNLRTNLATRLDGKSKRQLRDQVIEKLVEKNPVEVPPLMIERQLDFLLQDARRMVEQAKDPSLNAAIEKLKEEARPRATKQVAAMLILEAVARQEKIEVTEQEVEGRISELAREHRMNPKQVRAELKQNDQLEALRYNLRQDKALDLLLANAKIVEKKLTAEEAAAEDASDTGAGISE
jgi:trigger factor